MNKIQQKLKLFTLLATLLTGNVALTLEEAQDNELDWKQSSTEDPASERARLAREAKEREQLLNESRFAKGKRAIQSAMETGKKSISKFLSRKPGTTDGSLFSKPKPARRSTGEQDESVTPLLTREEANVSGQDLQPIDHPDVTTVKPPLQRAVDWLNSSAVGKWLTKMGNRGRDSREATRIAKSKAKGSFDKTEQEAFEAHLKLLNTKEKEKVANVWIDARISKFLDIKEKIKEKIEDLEQSTLPTNERIKHIDALRKELTAEEKALDNEMFAFKNELQQAVSPNEVVIALRNKSSGDTFFEIVDITKIDPTKSIQEQYSELKSSGFFGMHDPAVSYLKPEHLQLWHMSNGFWKSVQKALAALQKFKNNASGITVLQQDSSKRWSEEQLADKKSKEEATKEKIGLLSAGLSWYNVRSEEGTNCAYHALKNILLKLEQAQPADYLDLKILIKRLKEWVPIIYSRRSDLLKQSINEKNITDQLLKEKRSGIKDTELRSWINSNDGHIKTEMLSDIEAQALVNTLPADVQSQIVVLNDQDAGILQKSQDEINEAIIITGFDSHEGASLLKSSHDKIRSFKDAGDAILAVMWTEKGFGHWVSYMVTKKNNVIVKVDFMNSLEGKQPKNVELLWQLLGVSR